MDKDSAASERPIAKQHSAVADVYEAADKLLQTILNRSRDENDGTVGSGWRALNQSAEKFSELRQRKEKKEKEIRQALKLALQNIIDSLDVYIDRLDDQIAEIDERIDEIKTEMQEIEEIKEQIEDGTFDPNSEANQKLMKKYGFTKEDIDSGTYLIILNAQWEALHTEYGRWETKRKELADDRDRAKELREKLEVANQSNDPAQHQAVLKDVAREDIHILKKSFQDIDDRELQIGIVKAKNFSKAEEEVALTEAGEGYQDFGDGDLAAFSYGELSEKSFTSVAKLEDPIDRQSLSMKSAFAKASDPNNTKPEMDPQLVANLPIVGLTNG